MLYYNFRNRFQRLFMFEHTRTDTLQTIVLVLFTIFSFFDFQNNFHILIEKVNSGVIEFPSFVKSEVFFIIIIVFITLMLLINLVYSNNILSKALIVFNLVIISMNVLFLFGLTDVLGEDYVLQQTMLEPVLSAFVVFFILSFGCFEAFDSIAFDNIYLLFLIVGLIITLIMIVSRLCHEALSYVLFGGLSLISFLVTYTVMYDNAFNLVLFNNKFSSIVITLIFQFVFTILLFVLTGVDEAYCESNARVDAEFGFNNIQDSFSFGDIKNTIDKKGLLFVVVLGAIVIFLNLITDVSDVIDVFLGSDISSVGVSSLEDSLLLDNKDMLLQHILNMTSVFCLAYFGNIIIGIIEKQNIIKNKFLSYIFNAEISLILSYVILGHFTDIVMYILGHDNMELLGSLIAAIIGLLAPIFGLYAGISSFVLTLLNHVPIHIPAFVLLLILYVTGQYVVAVVKTLIHSKN